MKLDAKIEWVIDDSTLNIVAGRSETVAVDSDYVEADDVSIAEYIANELYDKYGMQFRAGYPEDGNCEVDYIIKNMGDLLFDLSEAKS